MHTGHAKHSNTIKRSASLTQRVADGGSTREARLWRSLATARRHRIPMSDSEDYGLSVSALELENGLIHCIYCRNSRTDTFGRFEWGLESPWALGVFGSHERSAVLLLV
jgi:hypothetical protein